MITQQHRKVIFTRFRWWSYLYFMQFDVAAPHQKQVFALNAQSSCAWLRIYTVYRNKSSSPFLQHIAHYLLQLYNNYISMIHTYINIFFTNIPIYFLALLNTFIIIQIPDRKNNLIIQWIQIVPFFFQFSKNYIIFHNSQLIIIFVPFFFFLLIKDIPRILIFYTYYLLYL